MRTTAIAGSIALALAGCSKAPEAAIAVPSPAEQAAIGEKAHAAYVAAINSNDVDTYLADLTDDVVLQAPGAPEIVGKAAVREWATGYVAAYKFVWKKRTLEFVVAGDWAFERYAYESADTDRKTNATTTDHGKGINIYRRGVDGQWRVARDGWSSDITPPQA